MTQKSAMTDVTAQLWKTPEAPASSGLSSSTRLSLLFDRLGQIVRTARLSQPFAILVFSEGHRLEQAKFGGPADVREFLSLYSETHAISLLFSRRKNAILLRIDGRLKPEKTAAGEKESAGPVR